MKIDDIIEKLDEEMSKDVEITTFNIMDKQMQLPAIKHKWVARIVRKKVEIDRQKQHRLDLKDQLIEKKKETEPVGLSLPSLEKKIWTLPKMIELSNDIKDNELILSYLKDCSKIFESMTWDFSNCTKLIQLEES